MQRKNRFRRPRFERLEERRLLAITALDYVEGDAGSSTRHASTYGSSSPIGVVHDIAYFSANDGGGYDLYASDGTPSGTRRILDVNSSSAFNMSLAVGMDDGNAYFTIPGGSSARTTLYKSNGTPEGTVALKINNSSTSIYGLISSGDRLFFQSEDPTTGRELWVSDGSAAGTMIIKDIHPGSSGSHPNSAIQAEDAIFFVADDGVHGFELWVSDGTDTGTRLVKDILPGSTAGSIRIVSSVGGDVYLEVSGGAHEAELWKSDGTEAGTVPLKNLYPGSPGSNIPFGNVAELNGLLLFFGRDENSSNATTSLWNSDGTAEGTEILHTFPPGHAPQPMTVLGNHVYFRGASVSSGDELWKSDGTAAGTMMVKDIRSGASGSGVSKITRAGETLYFEANDGVHGVELWATDGTDTGTRLVKDTRFGAPSGLLSGNGNRDLNTRFWAHNDKLYFAATEGKSGFELWRSDGTEFGTALVRDINPGDNESAPVNFVSVGDKILFWAEDTAGGMEPWISNGTEFGTTQLINVNTTGIGLNPSNLTELNGTYLFRGGDDLFGTELYQTDGTLAGTRLVADIYPGTNSLTGILNSSSPNELIRIGATVYFVATSANHGRELWKTDGTVAGTVMVKDIRPGSGSSSPSQLIDANGTLYFTANDGLNGQELWKSDGTAVGTVLVTDLRTGTPGSNPRILHSVGNTVYFDAYDGTYPNGLWRTDGTGAGTQLLKPIRANITDSTPFVELNGVLYFGASDSATGGELWRSDGTAAGTWLVRDINPGPGYAISSNHPTVFDGRLYFSANDGVAGSELWVSDGTAAGTRMVKDIQSGIYAGSNPSKLVNFEGALYFVAQHSANGSELWKTDGTAVGTSLVKDINSGSQSSSIGSFVELDGKLYFTANDGVHGRELWTTDGTEAGTTLVEDYRPGSLGAFSGDEHLTVSGGRLFGVADNGTSGRDLWTYAPQPPAGPIQFSLSEQSVSEEVGTVTVQAKLDQVSDVDITIPLGIVGSTAGSDDYELPDYAVVIPAGRTTGSVSITIADDELHEPIEQLRLIMGTPSSGVLGDSTLHTIYITDNDFQPRVAFYSSPWTSSGGRQAREGDATHTLVAVLSSPSGIDVTVPVTFSGTAIAGADYNILDQPLDSPKFFFPAGSRYAYINVQIIDDAAPEGFERFSVVMQTPTNAALSTFPTDDTVHVVVIAASDAPTVSLTSSTGVVDENGADRRTTIEARLSEATTYDITVPLILSDQLSWNASLGADYRLVDIDGNVVPAGQEQIVIPAGQTESWIYIDVLDDTLQEEDEWIGVQIGPLDNAALSYATRASIEIPRNDIPKPVVTFSKGAGISSDFLAEDLRFQTGYVTVQLSEPILDDLEVPIVVAGGSAKLGTDYTLLTSVILIPAGRTSVREHVLQILDDSVDEADETVLLKIGDMSNAIIGSAQQSSHVIKLLSDDQRYSFTRAAGVSASGNMLKARQVAEGAGQVAFEVNLSHPVLDMDVWIPFSVAGVAKQPSDYSIVISESTGYRTVLNGSTHYLIINRGYRTGQIKLNIKQDATIETTETATIALGNSPTHEAGEYTRQPFTIVSDDVPEVVFDVKSASVKESKSRTVTVKLMAPVPDKDVRVTIKVDSKNSTAK